MSERWVLLPEELTEEMLEAATVNERSDRSDGEIMVAWKMLLDSRPPVSREWLDAAVEKGARAIWARHIPEFEYDSIQYAAEKYRVSARAVLNAIGIREDGE